jgi:hypothetical protein
MDQHTSLTYFNETLKSFINEIIETFPEFKEVLELYYDDILEDGLCTNDKYVKRFIRKLSEHKLLISKRDPALFENSIMILKNVDFKIIFSSDELSEENRDSIWKYIQTLYVLGETIINDSNKIKSIVNTFQKFRKGDEEGEQEEEQGETAEGEHADEEILSMLKNLSETNKNSPPLPDNILETGIIGKLATELANDIKLDNLDLDINENSNVDDVFNNLLSGGNPMKFMNLLQTVGSKIQEKVENSELDQNELINEATKMMSSLQGGNNSLFEGLLKGGLPDLSAMVNPNPNPNPNPNTNPNPNPNTNNRNVSNPTADRLRRKLENKKKNS